LQSARDWGALGVTLSAASLKAVYRDAFSGNRIPGVPDRTAYLDVRWRPGPGFDLGFEARHSARIFVNDANSDSAPAYSVASARAGYELRMGSATLRTFLRVDNLFARRYAGSVIVNEGNARFFEPAPGRTWLAGVSLRLSALGLSPALDVGIGHRAYSRHDEEFHASRACLRPPGRVGAAPAGQRGRGGERPWAGARRASRARTDWRTAVISQKLRGGAFVRTGDSSTMALLMQDKTQLRLNQNSLVQIKETSAAGAPTRLELRGGRAVDEYQGPVTPTWSSRPRTRRRPFAAPSGSWKSTPRARRCWRSSRARWNSPMPTAA
jgi:hypothetical protein